MMSKVLKPIKIYGYLATKIDWQFVKSANGG